MRKENSAYYFGKSTYELSLYMKICQDTIWDKYGLAREAFDLGNHMYQKALKEGKPLAISVTRNRQRLFYAAAEGTSVENDNWIMRKENSAYYFGKSTYELSLYMKIRQDTIWDKYGLARDQYAQSAGCMPISAKGFGMIGTATVSGMSQKEDQAFLMEALMEWIEER